MNFRAREERISEAGRVQFDAFYAGLALRTAHSLKTLHVLAEPGRLFSMDFGVGIPVEFPAVPYAKREYPCCGAMRAADELLRRVGYVLTLYEPEEIITPLSRADWWEFWVADLIGMRPVELEQATRGRVFMVLRGVVR